MRSGDSPPDYLDTVGSLAHHEIKRIMRLDAHGGNIKVSDHAACVASNRSGAFVILPSKLPGCGESERKSLMDIDVHAENTETVAALALIVSFQ